MLSEVAECAQFSSAVSSVFTAQCANDEPLRYVLDPLLDEALKAEPAEAWTYTFSNAARPFTEFPARLLNLATRMEAVVVLLASLDLVVERPAHVAARSVITSGNSRSG